MNTRRTFLKTAAAAAGGVFGWEKAGRADEQQPLNIRDARVVRFRDRDGGPVDSYLQIAGVSGLTGYAGPLMKEQAAALPANLRELLAGRDARDPEKLNFHTLWAACHPDKTLESYAEGRDPLTGAPVWGIRRAARHTETGWRITAFSAIDLAISCFCGQPPDLPLPNPPHVAYPETASNAIGCIRIAGLRTFPW